MSAPAPSDDAAEGGADVSKASPVPSAAASASVDARAAPPPTNTAASLRRSINPKASSSSLASSLAAHLARSVAPASTSASQPPPPPPAPAAAPAASPHARPSSLAPTTLPAADVSSRPSPSLLAATTAAAPQVRSAMVAAPSIGRAVPAVSAESDLWRTSAAKRAEKAWAIQSEKALQSDAKFKKHAAAVERALASFETVSEWADFISFLSRLLKTLQAAPQFNAIPRKLTVAKRLSQCLNPALPSGVHQKALEVYAHILGVLGVEGLRRDLAVWMPGLLPFFQFASTSVKPAVIAILERHVLPLRDDLRPVTRSLLLALLPGLEEEAGEFFDRVLALLDAVAEGVGRSAMLQNVWLVLISSPSVRLSALNYLARRLPALGPTPSLGADLPEAEDPVHPGEPAHSREQHERVTAALGPDLGLVARAFAAALLDEVLLVRRAALDLLVTHVRLDSPAFATCMRREDRVILVRAALTVVLRRDLSLNRRLYAWLLGAGVGAGAVGGATTGPADARGRRAAAADEASGRAGLEGAKEDEEASQVEYLERWGLELLCDALRRELWLDVPVGAVPDSSWDVDAEAARRQRPLRIFISLLDKWEIGQPLSQALGLETLAAVRYQLLALDALVSRASSSSSSSQGTGRAGASFDAASSRDGDTHGRGTSASQAAVQVRTDLHTTAVMLLQAIDPYVLYGLLFERLAQEVGREEGASDTTTLLPISTAAGREDAASDAGGQRPESAEAGATKGATAVTLFAFLLDAFRIHDEEVRQLHLPALFATVVEAAGARMRVRMPMSPSLVRSLLRALRVAREMLARVPPRVFQRLGEPSGDGSGGGGGDEAGDTRDAGAGASSSSASAALPKVGLSSFVDAAAHFYQVSSAAEDGEASSADVGSPSGAAATTTTTTTTGGGAAQAPAPTQYVSFQNAAAQLRLLGLVSSLAMNAHKAPGEPELLVVSLQLAAELLQLLDDAAAATEAEGRDAAAAARGGAADPQASVAKLEWSAVEAWGSNLVDDLARASSYAQTVALVEALVSAASCGALARPLRLGGPERIRPILEKLLEYTLPDASPYHVRTVELLWDAESVSGGRHLASILCAGIVDVDGERRRRALDSFGVLWRHTEEANEMFVRLSAPLLRVLDGLRSGDWLTRQQAEMWLRSYLRSYLPVVDALLPWLIDPNIEREAVERVALWPGLADVRLREFVYVDVIDYELVRYALNSLAALARFGAANFTRALRAAPVSQSRTERASELLERLDVPTSVSYLDALLDLLVLFLRTSPPEDEERRALHVANANVHALAVELIQILVSRSRLDEARLTSVETCLLERVLLSVADSKSDAAIEGGQSKSLHALHTVMSTRVAHQQDGKAATGTSTTGSPAGKARKLGTAAAGAAATAKRGHSPHPLLLRTLRAGLAQGAETAQLQHWADFILGVVPLYPTALNVLLLPLNETACGLLRDAVVRLEAAYRGEGSMAASGDARCRVTELDVTLLIGVAERTLLQCLDVSSSSANAGSTRAAAAASAAREEEEQLLSASAAAPGVGATRASDGSIRGGAPGLASTDQAGGVGGGGGGGGGLLGYVSNVFTSEPAGGSGATQQGARKSTTNVNQVLQALHHTVFALHAVWMVSGDAAAGDRRGEVGGGADAEAVQPDAYREASLRAMQPKARGRCRRSFERLYRSHSGEVVEALIDCWSAVRHDDAAAEGVFDILALLAPGCQILVTFVCDVISTRASQGTLSGGTAGASSSALGQGGLAAVGAVSNDKAGRGGAFRGGTGAPVSVFSLFLFLEAYLSRLDAAASLQVWPVVIVLAKELVANSSSHKPHLFPMLRCFTTIGEKLAAGNAGAPGGSSGGGGGKSGASSAQASPLDDRRLRRDLSETFVKLVDLCVLISGRAFDQTTWIRRATAGSSVQDDDGLGGMAEANADGVPEGAAAGGGDEEKGGASGSLQAPASDAQTPATTSSRDAINEFLASRCVPALRKFGIDADKTMSVLANMTYYIITPLLRRKSGGGGGGGSSSARGALDFNESVLALLSEAARIPNSLKAWRAPVAEVLQDARFFRMSVRSAERWKPLVVALLSGDRERLAELISRVSAASAAANIFANREAEAAARALSLRRLGFAVLAAPRDHFLPQLPSVQERVVDILRAQVVEKVTAEVYLFMQVLLLRFSMQHLASFWPVIITEMMRLLEEVIESPPADGTDGVQVVLSACKFLDLLLTMQTADFQIHQWLFVTDTVDVVYPPDEWEPESLVQRVAQRLSDGGEAGASRRDGVGKGSTPSIGAGSTTTASSVVATPKVSAPSTPTTASTLGRGGGAAATGAPPAARQRPDPAPRGRRPLLLDVRSVRSVYELQPFFARVSLASYEAQYAARDVDSDAVELGLLRDMFSG